MVLLSSAFQCVVDRLRTYCSVLILRSQTGNTLLGALEQNGLPTNVTQDPALFPLPAAANISESNFNVSARVTTDGEFRCLDQATITSAIKHNLFPSLWYYEFNRSYQTTGFSPNFPHCEAPITEEDPFGDTTQEYYKCVTPYTTSYILTDYVVLADVTPENSTTSSGPSQHSATALTETLSTSPSCNKWSTPGPPSRAPSIRIPTPDSSQPKALRRLQPNSRANRSGIPSRKRRLGRSR